MNETPNKIPDGWVEVKKGQVIKEGDKCRFRQNSPLKWYFCQDSIGEKWGTKSCFVKPEEIIVITKIPQKPTISKEQLAIKIAQLINKYNINNK